MDRPAGTIGVLVVDDHAVVRRGVCAYLDVLDDVTVIGEAVDGEDALAALAVLAAQDRLPDVVLMDLQMPRLDGVATTRQIVVRFPAVRVVILTSFGESERIHSALQQGAAGYLLKDAGPDEVAAALHAAARGEVFLDAAVARRLTEELRAPHTGLNSLTSREREILVLVADGLSNKEIAPAGHQRADGPHPRQQPAGQARVELAHAGRPRCGAGRSGRAPLRPVRPVPAGVSRAGRGPRARRWRPAR